MNIFLTGATGYLGNALVPRLLERGHHVRAIVRSRRRLPRGVDAVVGNPLEPFRCDGADTFIQLLGVPHPSPAKAKQFREVDLVSIRRSVEAATASNVKHFIYLSVAHPAPMMHAYIEVRAEGERLLRESGIPATILRPWYILGPGHRWPYLILPIYWLWPGETSRRLYPVRLKQVVDAIVDAVDAPPAGVRIIEGPELRGAATPARRDAMPAPAHRRS